MPVEGPRRGDHLPPPGPRSGDLGRAGCWAAWAAFAFTADAPAFAAGAFMRKRRRSWTRQKPTATPAPDLVNRNFKADAPDRLLVADSSRIPSGEGPLWLASTNRPPTPRTAVRTCDQQAAQAKSPTAPVGAGQKAVGDLLVDVTSQNANRPLQAEAPTIRL